MRRRLLYGSHLNMPSRLYPIHSENIVLQELKEKKEEIEFKIVDEEELRAAKGVLAYLNYVCA